MYYLTYLTFLVITYTVKFKKNVQNINFNIFFLQVAIQNVYFNIKYKTNNIIISSKLISNYIKRFDELDGICLYSVYKRRRVQ